MSQRFDNPDKPGLTDPISRPPAKPVPPDSGECCGIGCAPCIWDYYHQALHRWQQKMAAWEAHLEHKQ